MQTPHRLTLLLALAASCAGPSTKSADNAFFPMDTAFMPAARFDPAVFAEHFDHLYGLGLRHYGWRLEGLELAVPEGQRLELELVAVYVTTSIDDERVPERVLHCIEQMEGTGSTLWLALRSERHAGSDVAGDESALRFLDRVCELTEARGLRVALYPHTGFWLERYSDAVRITRALGRNDVGATFNLCHWLKVEGEADPLRAIGASLSELVLVTINGADSGGTDWQALIQPLDSGTYDVGAFVQAVHKAGYRGPFGLQGYGVPGDSRRNLERAWTHWRQITDPAAHSPRR